MIYRDIPENFNTKFEVVSCYLEHDGQILLLLRQDHKSEGNKWGMPAGKIDQGESELKAIVRETREETGQEIPFDQFEYLSKVYVRYPDYDFIYHMFKAQLTDRPQVVLSEGEHKDYQWIAPQAALELDLVKDNQECILLVYQNKLLC